MTKSNNVTIIRKLFDAFGKGEIATALGMFADEVDFRSPVTRSRHNLITWAKPRKTREEVAAFYKEMGSRVQAEKMEIVGILSQDDRVVVEGRNRGTVRASGRGFEHDWVMVFEIQDGKIVKNHHYYDTADLIPALQGRE